MKTNKVFIKIIILFVLIVILGYFGVFVSLSGMSDNTAEDLTGKAYSTASPYFKQISDRFFQLLRKAVYLRLLMFLL